MIFVSSVAGMVPFAGYSMYTPAKAAIRGQSGPAPENDVYGSLLVVI